MRQPEPNIPPPGPPPPPRGRGHYHGPPWTWQAGSEPPPWWPDDLAWPPDADTWAKNRRRMMHKALFGLIAFVFVIAMAVWLVMTAVTGDFRLHGPARGLGVLFLLLVVIAVVRMGRNARSFLTFADVMQAADRVALGDYTVRVNERAPGQTHQLAVSFNTMAQRLQENDEQRRAFFADIAHELRTPLSVVRGTIEAMLDGVYPQDSEHLTPLLDEVAVITRLLEDLQLVATAEAGGLKLYRERVDLGTLDDDLVAAFRPKAEAAGVCLKADIPSGIWIDLDPVRIRQVLENLLSNAIRYTPEGGEILVNAVPLVDEVRISVRDCGAGMSEEQAERIFDRFVKSADSGGSGLGLAIARSLVEAHGGRIWAESSPGAGTTVTFTLPR